MRESGQFRLEKLETTLLKEQEGIFGNYCGELGAANERH